MKATSKSIASALSLKSRNCRAIALMTACTIFLLFPIYYQAARGLTLSQGESEQVQQSDDQTVIARMMAKTEDEKQKALALGLDLLEMRDGDDLFLLTTNEQIEQLRGKGWQIKVDEEQTTRLREQRASFLRGQQTANLSRKSEANSVQWGYRSVTEMRALVDNAARLYPNLAEAFVYGRSWEGKDLFGVKLTNKQKPGPKPTFLLMAAIHPREMTTSELALRLINHLLSRYGWDGDVTWLLDEHLIVIVPVVNPDGRVLAEQGLYKRKNTNWSYGRCPDHVREGVDLERNLPHHHGEAGTSNNPCDDTYPGPQAASEPETRALLNLVLALFPDQRGPSDADPAPANTTGILLTLHSFSNLVLWPWGWANKPTPNASDLSLIGGKLASYNGYTPKQSVQLYATPTSGTTIDLAYGWLGIAAFALEIGPTSGPCGGFFPSFNCLDGGDGGSFWSRNLPAFIYAARIARAPYELVKGPTPEDVSVASTSEGGFTLRATLDDKSNGGQAVVSVEYYLDTPPWRGGVPHPMSPQDGQFNSTLEVATAPIGAVSGRTIFVRGRDASGNWGPVRATIARSGGICATQSAVADIPEISSSFEMLYQLRDEVFPQSEFGQELVKIHQEHSFQAAKILFANPRLRAQLLDLLEASRPALNSLLNGDGQFPLNQELTSKIESYVRGVALRASPEMRAKLLNVMEEANLHAYEGKPVGEVWKEVGRSRQQDQSPSVIRRQ